MEIMTNITSYSDPDYYKHFWNSAKGRTEMYDIIDFGRHRDTNTFELPTISLKKYNEYIAKKSIFRNIASVHRAYRNQYNILAKDTQDVAQWVGPGEGIEVTDGADDFTQYKLGCWKLATLTRYDEAFVHDAAFDMEDCLMEQFATMFANAEDNAFINGSGVNEPTGILAESGGAEVGVTAADSTAITYEEIVRLYFSVKPSYRKNGVWLMNDETAMALRSLKDAGGNFIWNHTSDTIFGKKVVITEYMPSADSASKPIAFGDFKYYWVVPRKPMSCRAIVEMYAMANQIGYIGYELIDGKLIRPEAIKVLQMAE